jgi:uncharacterized protein YecE (DUF72 family)
MVAHPAPPAGSATGGAQQVGTLWVGTSGWVYPHWRGIFYPPKLPGYQQLAYYAARFDSVEVNYSFYRLPERGVFERWRQQAPPRFLFAVKGSRYLTHLKKLKEPAEPLGRLLERAGGLGEKLGPILFQLPPNWPLDLERLTRFIEALQAYPTQRFALEFRHPSWLSPSVYALLERGGVALCLPISPKVPLELRLTAPWTYLRFHVGQQGWGFTDAELAIWSQRLAIFRAAGQDCYVYFNNDPGGHALRDAERLRQMASA